MHPSIQILEGVQGAGQAKGIAVVIDVLRAFSTACYVMAAGARQLLTTADKKRAVQLGRRHPHAILIGEYQGVKIPGFDLSNSPSQVEAVDWSGRTAILTTTNGTLGLAAAQSADEVLTGSFVNAGAIDRYIQRKAPSHVSLICMGSRGNPAIEDNLCAQCLKADLLGRPSDFVDVQQRIMRSSTVDRFRNDTHKDMPHEDLDMCLTLDRFDFVLRAVAEPLGGIRLERIGV